LLDKRLLPIRSLCISQKVINRDALVNSQRSERTTGNIEFGFGLLATDPLFPLPAANHSDPSCRIPFLAHPGSSFQT
jgi:hypothetical protein